MKVYIKSCATHYIKPVLRITDPWYIVLQYDGNKAVHICKDIPLVFRRLSYVFGADNLQIYSDISDKSRIHYVRAEDLS